MDEQITVNGETYIRLGSVKGAWITARTYAEGEESKRLLNAIADNLKLDVVRAE